MKEKVIIVGTEPVSRKAAAFMEKVHRLGMEAVVVNPDEVQPTEETKLFIDEAKDILSRESFTAKVKPESFESVKVNDYRILKRSQRK